MVEAPHAGGLVVDNPVLAVEVEANCIDRPRRDHFVARDEAAGVELGLQGRERLAAILLVPTVQDG
eukprot:5367606-Heterocapsa_arctica.AAC.1